MANIGAALKGLDWKELLINHCEKIVMGSVGLFVLTSLGSTTWSSYKTEPEEIQKKVDAGNSAYAASRWPEENKKDFEARDLGNEVAKLTQGITPSATDIYTMGSTWVRPIYPPKLKRGEVNWLTLDEPIADAGKVLLAFPITTNSNTGDSSTPVVVVDKSGDTGTRPPIDDDTAPRNNGDGPRNGPMATGTNPMQPALSDGPVPGGGGRRGQPQAGGHGGPTSIDPSQMMGGGMNQAGSTGRNVDAQGLRFVSVRAAFPLKQQLEEVRKALQLETTMQAWDQVRFADFKIQRQTAQAGDKPWAGKWEDVNIQKAIDVLSRVEFDVDFVEEKYRDPVITMPLPYRETGSWKAYASHPKIKKMLSDEEAARQEAANRAAIETAEKLKLKQTGGRGGFQGVQHNTRDIQRQIMGNSSAMNTYNEMFSNFSSEGTQMGPGQMPGGGGGHGAAGPGSFPMPGGGVGGGGVIGGGGHGAGPTSFGPQGMGGGMAMGGMQGGMGAAGISIPELLLFRYIDFEVIPGNAYRYRIQLQMKNPNNGWDANELKDPSSANGDTRENKFSEPTNYVIIEDDLKFFVSKVDAKPNLAPLAELDVFQWLTESGSFVMAKFEKLARGDQISAVTGKDARSSAKTGGMKLDLLRAANQTYKEEVINFETPNVVLNMSVNTIVAPEENPDLELPARRLTTRLEEVVMVNRFGEIVDVDNVSSKQAKEQANARIKNQEDNFKHLRAASTAAAAGPMGLEGLLGAGGHGGTPGAAPGAADKQKNNRRQGSSLKRGAQGMGGMGGMMGPGAMPGL